MQFVFTALTWGFFLALVPLLIHLINMMRHRRVQWAAMEFLLESYRRHRRWIWMKQLLLLLLRMMAVAAIVAMLASLVTRDQWWQIFSGQTTHHFVLLDDSLSMSDQQASDSAFLTAQRVVSQIIAQATRQATPQRLTLVRSSQAGLAPATSTAEEQGATATARLRRADLVDELLTVDFDPTWEALRRQWRTSDLGSTPREALELIAQQVQQAPDQRSVVYLVSDFRQRDWSDATPYDTALAELTRAGADLHAIRSAEQQHANLAVLSMEVAEGTVAAGVPMFVQVAVHNYGPQPAEQVELTLRTHWYSSPTSESAQIEELPRLVIERIEAGETVMRQAQVYFPTAGRHVVEAVLPNDSILSDNRRWTVIDLPVASRVLVIDGDEQQRNAFYLQAVFSPGERAVTGIETDLQSETYLRSVTLPDLKQFDAVYLLDVPRLEAATVSELTDFVRQGGGLALFAGPRVDLRFYNQLASNPQTAWMPVALQNTAQLPRQNGSVSADVVAGDNSVFRVLAARGGQPNPFARSLRVDRYLRADLLPERPSSEILARLRDGNPLVVEQPLGRGRVVTWLTTLAPTWNNWALEPTFPVVLLQLQARLASSRARAVSQQVGTAIQGVLDVGRYQRTLEFVLPSSTTQARTHVRRQYDQEVSDITQTIAFQLGVDPETGRRTGQSDTSGIYDVVSTTLSGDREVLRFALNADASDGRTALVPAEQLESLLEPYGVSVHDASQWTAIDLDRERSSWSHWILYGLILGLVAEQWLAFSCSYHVMGRTRR